MRKHKFRPIILLLLSAIILTACTAQTQPDSNPSAERTKLSSADTCPKEKENSPEEKKGSPEPDTETFSRPFTGQRPLLIKNMAATQELDFVPSAEAYTLEPDLSNIDNLWQFHMQEGLTAKLAKNGFVVYDNGYGSAGSEFYEIYEQNRYQNIPSFITVDSMMHTYHLYFSYLLKNVEKNYLSDRILLLSRQMLQNSMEQYQQLKGSEWETAAKRNVAFFTIGATLAGDTIETDNDAENIVLYELDCIHRADGIHTSEITGKDEDYTQYIPRGYYTNDEKLEQYFQAMMWYGRIHFSQDKPDLVRSSLLISQILSENPESYGLWESIYAVTSFFAGASDDVGICEYIPVIRDIYGEHIDISSLTDNEEAFERFYTATSSLATPQINSMPLEGTEKMPVPGFRFMGQRFTIDAAIMQQLVYSNVQENKNGQKRMLPDVLDVPAALGSDTALQILEENGATAYTGYSENMNRLRALLSEENSTLWSASLYANWLHTLRPLLTPKGEGYPTFMQNEEWTKKNLECFAGSFTELKHDTVLYSKQVMAEMGGDYYEETDDRGYVEPEPLIYARFSSLAQLTAQGLKEYKLLSSADEENLSRLIYIAEQLRVISSKELKNEILTDEEYEFIKTYGGNIEHFWYEAIQEADSTEGVSAKEYPAAIITDIATDPGGEVLEAATGDPLIIYVAVKVDDTLKLTRGSVYSFYQFTWPIEDRLTDSKWRQMMGLQPDESGNYNFETQMSSPSWTGSYRYTYDE